MNKQEVVKLKIDDGNDVLAIDIDRNEPFAIVFPVNAGNITFYDVNGNRVEYYTERL